MGRGSGAQSNSPLSLRCRSSSGSAISSLSGIFKRPTCFVGALGRTLNVQGVRLACGRRAPPRIWTFLCGLRGLTGSSPGRPLKTSGATKVEAGRSQADSLAEPPRLTAEGARGPDRGQRVRHEAVDADARQPERDRRIGPVTAEAQ